MPYRYVEKVTGTPVELGFGSHRFVVPVDYIMGSPFKDNEFKLALAWPSMVSYHEASIKAKQTGDPNFHWAADSIEIWVRPTGPNGIREPYFVMQKDLGKTWPVTKVEKIGLYKMTTPGHEFYWPFDPSVRTPVKEYPYMFDCDLGSETDTRLTCFTAFQLEPGVSIAMHFTKLHMRDWKPMFYQVQNFIQSIKAPPPATLPVERETRRHPLRRHTEGKP